LKFVISIEAMMEMTNDNRVILGEKLLGFPWETNDPFLFCVYHADNYPKGNDRFGPDASLEGRKMGYDFVLKDGWRMYHGKEVPGFPVHPHRGFETITVVRKGIVDHSDSLGGADRYGQGDVQWMTAGKGIQHSEMFPLLNRDSTNPLELFQIWLNLPGNRKMVEPYYTMLWDNQIPKITEKDSNGRSTRIEIVAGHIRDHHAPAPAPDSWAADPGNEVAVWYIEIEPYASWSLPVVSSGIYRSLFFFQGGQIKINEQSVRAGNLLELNPSRETTLKNGMEQARFLLLQGKPIGEPVVNFGPFVMNTRSEIQRTYIDYQATRFGGWPWPREEQVHPGNKGRFARYADGHEEFPE
jgi:redox-sensitive bicupin YhaK (pirin superfamily)